MKGKLIKSVINNKNTISYINLDDENKYRGWVYDFNIRLQDKSVMKLDLADEEDLFLLFILASAWTKNGPWENAAYFTTYLKSSNKCSRELWMNDEFVSEEVLNRKVNAQNIVNSCSGVMSRKKVSFRKDYYNSIVIIAENWEDIMDKLKTAEKEQNYMIFISYISNLKGLGAGSNKMKIKIPLILRELRCQDVYKGIPGNLCCVPDKRVVHAANGIGIKLPTISSINSILKASQVIYESFGDMYDIPLFAYEDLNINKDKVIVESNNYENLEAKVFKMTKTLYDPEVEERGIQKGIEKGIEEGIKKSKRESILELLSELGEVPNEVKSEIHKITDVDKLKSLLKLSAKAESIESFKKNLL